MLVFLNFLQVGLKMLAPGEGGLILPLGFDYFETAAPAQNARARGAPEILCAISCPNN